MSWATSATRSSRPSSGAPSSTFSRERLAEEERLLRHEPDRAAQLGERQPPDVDAVEQHRAAVGVVGPDQQVHQRGLARAGGADDRERPPRVDPERDVLQHPAALPRAGIAEPDVAELDRAPAAGRRQRDRRASGSAIAGRSRKSWLIRPIDAAPRCTRLTAQPSAIIGQTSIARYTPKATNAPTVTVPAITSRPPAYSTDQPAQAAQQGEQREEQALHPGEPRLRAEVVVAQAAEAVDLGPFLPVGADHAHAGEILVGVAGEVAELLLDRLAAAVDPLPQRDHRDRQPQQRHQREQRSAAG